ncbi:MAG: Endonuclease III [Chlamydiales bacterium]|nr:Endonuclease III [Chlamydiales bacterium]
MTPATIRRLLNQYIPDPPIPLRHKDSYTLLIAVLLSARSTDAMVNRVTPELFERASTPEEMVQLTVAQIRKIIQPVGLSPQKARAIKELSSLLLEEHNGEVPQTFHELEAFPGVGHKTASVVMVQAFGHPAFPVDTHIYRCARRWGLSKGTTVAAVEKDLKALFKEEEWGRIHLQIIHFARKYCPARRHNPEECPICQRLSSENAC